MVSYFFSQGVDVNLRDIDGLIVLYYVLKEGYVIIVKVLIDKGSDFMFINDKSVLEFYEVDLLKLFVCKGFIVVL